MPRWILVVQLPLFLGLLLWWWDKGVSALMVVAPSSSRLVPSRHASSPSPSRPRWFLLSAATDNLQHDDDSTSSSATTDAASTSCSRCSTSTKIATMIDHVTTFMACMVDTTSSSNHEYRFYSLCHPFLHEYSHDHHVPLRDLAAAWDATTAIQFRISGHTNHTLHNHKQTVPKDDRIATLRHAVESTLQVYRDSAMTAVVDDDDYLHFHSDSTVMQGQPSTIAHSGMWILAAAMQQQLQNTNHCNYYRENDQLLATNDTKEDCYKDMMVMMIGLTRGILAQQQDNGAFASRFDMDDHDLNDSDNIYHGIAFYPGEAMVALMEVYSSSSWSTTTTTDTTIRCDIAVAMERALGFYSDLYYHQHTNIHNKLELDVNYPIWQLQAFARYYLSIIGGDPIPHHDSSHNHQHHPQQRRAEHAYRYVLDLANAILNSPAWKALGRGMTLHLEAIEIACGLDALAQAWRVLLANRQANIHTIHTSDHDDDDEHLLELIRLRATQAIDYLQQVQELTLGEPVGSGGLVYGLSSVEEQRLDVTGHALSALVKLHPLYCYHEEQSKLLP